MQPGGAALPGTAMDPTATPPDAVTFAWRLLATAFFVAANGFFVAAEFALVKVRATQLHALAERGLRRARVAQHIHQHLDRYLSACQLGITLSSLILGWLAEPAIAELLLAGARALGWPELAGGAASHAVAIGLALTVVTLLHMVLGEQAPKIWAIHRAPSTALWSALPLQAFERLFRPFIWFVNTCSNGVLRAVGLSPEGGEGTHSVDELRAILEASAAAGQISRRQLELAENVFRMVELEVRHIMVPRVDVVFLSLQWSIDENLRIVRKTRHSRFPLCELDLDSVVGIVHAKELLGRLADGEVPDLRKLARRPLFVSDTQPLARLIARMQASASHCAVVLDEHGTAVGLAFLEDALEEIVGPIRDEFDPTPPQVEAREDGSIEVPGSLPLPEAVELLDLPELGDEADTIGGQVVALLGRLPQEGDQIEIGRYRVTVTDVARRRVRQLLFEPLREGTAAAAGPTTSGRES